MKFIKRIIKTIILISIIVAIINATGFEWPSWVVNSYNKVGKIIENNVSNVEKNTKDYVRVERVVDGDTFIVIKNSVEEKVRLIGVDTPESVATGKNAYKNCKEGKIASNYTKKLIENKKVKIITDVEKEDKYGRILAYVYLKDGRMLNKILLRKGYARTMTIAPNVAHSKEFKKIQKKAKENKKGFWNRFSQWK